MSNKLKAKDVIIQFCEVYRTTYGVSFCPNWGRDSSMIKNKLIGTFTDEEIRAIIEISVKEYDTRWARANYPRPSIGAICSWLANEAMTVKQEREKEQEIINQRSEINVNQYLDKL